MNLNLSGIFQRLKTAKHKPERSEVDVQLELGQSVVSGFMYSLWYALITMFATALMALLATWALAGPEVPARSVGIMLAQVCQQTGECRMQVLLPAFAIANIILIHLLVYFLWNVSRWVDTNGDEGIRSDVGCELERVMQPVYDAVNDLQEKIICISQGKPVPPTLTGPVTPPPPEPAPKKSIDWGFVLISIGLAGLVLTVLIGAIRG